MILLVIINACVLFKLNKQIKQLEVMSKLNAEISSVQTKLILYDKEIK